MVKLESNQLYAGGFGIAFANDVPQFAPKTLGAARALWPLGAAAHDRRQDRSPREGDAPREYPFKRSDVRAVAIDANGGSSVLPRQASAISRNGRGPRPGLRAHAAAGDRRRGGRDTRLHAVSLPVLGVARAQPEISRHADAHRHRGDRPHRDAGHRGGAQPRAGADRAAGGGCQRRHRRRHHGRRQRPPRIEGMLHRHLLSTGMAAYPGQLGRRAVRHVAHLRQRQPGRGHVLQRRGREHRARAGGAAVQRDPGSGHEGHAALHDRARHHAPAAVAGGDRGAGRAGGRAADPEQLPAEQGRPDAQLRFLRHRPEGLGGAGWAAGRTVRRWTARAPTACSRTCPWARCRISARHVRTALPRRSRSAEQHPSPVMA